MCRSRQSTDEYGGSEYNFITCNLFIQFIRWPVCAVIARKCVSQMIFQMQFTVCMLKALTTSGMMIMIVVDFLFADNA